MSTSSRSTIFSLRSKRSKDSTEIETHAGPAYDDLPMSPRPPIKVPTILPPPEHITKDDESSDSYSVKSDGYRPSPSVIGSISGPRPLPSKAGSADRLPESSRLMHETPNVLVFLLQLM
jgi:hypothetical protein